MSVPGDARRSNDGATAQRASPARYALAMGLLVLGAGALAVIDLVLLPRYLAGAPSVLRGDATGVAVVPTVAAPHEVAAVAKDSPSPPRLPHANAPTPATPATPAPSTEVVAAPAAATVPNSLAFPHMLFARNTSWLSPSTKATLARVARVLAEQPGRRVVLSGHTDRAGSEDFNRALSMERARRCSRWLKARGIDPARIEIQGFGSTRPLTDDDSPTAQAHNRRVEVTLR